MRHNSTGHAARAARELAPSKTSAVPRSANERITGSIIMGVVRDGKDRERFLRGNIPTPGRWAGPSAGEQHMVRLLVQCPGKCLVKAMTMQYGDSRDVLPRDSANPRHLTTAPRRPLRSYLLTWVVAYEPLSNHGGAGMNVTETRRGAKRRWLNESGWSGRTISPLAVSRIMRSLSFWDGRKSGYSCKDFSSDLPFCKPSGRYGLQQSPFRWMSTGKSYSITMTHYTWLSFYRKW